MSSWLTSLVPVDVCVSSFVFSSFPGNTWIIVAYLSLSLSSSYFLGILFGQYFGQYNLLIFSSLLIDISCESLHWISCAFLLF